MITEESLPVSFHSVAIDYYLPLASFIVKWTTNKTVRSPLIVGVNGAQGTGKSTLSKVLALALENKHQLKTAILSIDDIYLTQQERIDLSNTVHPLLRTRGVPGTHDIHLGIDIIKKLKAHQPVSLPVFSKATDDRALKEDWITCTEPVDIILFEGWCIGAIPEPEAALTEPCNSLEANEDSNAVWRTFANTHLERSYAEMFELMDYLVMLKAPNFECVYDWRSTQEEKLRKRSSGHDNDGIMDDDQIQRFIMHYERITRWMFKEMPSRADCVLELNSQHNITKATYSRS